ncbi:MAG: universal stress protein [Alphaproteobacteria bacterium]
MYDKILLTIDLTDESSWRKALPTAVEYCRAFDSTLHLLMVVPDYGMTVVGHFFPKDYADEVVARSRKELEEFSATHVPPGITVRHIVAYGTIYEEILITARKIAADLIVIGSHRPELKDYLIGPNAARVVRHASCSVLVVRD